MRDPFQQPLDPLNMRVLLGDNRVQALQFLLALRQLLEHAWLLIDRLI